MKKNLKIPPPPGKPGRKNPIGAKISGRFEILRLLGTGSTGRVYEAVQLSVDRAVAVKVLQAEAKGETRERFAREAKAIAKLNHPNCITLHDFGYSDEIQSLYMVTEFVRGREMFEVLLEEDLPLSTVLRYFLQVGEGLAHAHKNKVLHRDLKPENVLVTNRGDVKVLDFGLARIFSEIQGPEARRLTTEGAIFGTPVYMCPEQCGGDLDVDERADLYALGVMMYEAFEGEPPFDANDVMRTLVAHIQEPVPPMKADIPETLRDLTLQLLEKDRDARPESAKKVVERLQAILVDLMVSDAELTPDVSQEIARSLLMQGLSSEESSVAGLESPASSRAAAWERPGTMDLLGNAVGPYKVKRLLGSGSMGAVFQAKGPDGERVALKVLSTKVDEGLRVGERFEREERALRGIADPRVVQILGAGYDERLGRAYMAMEYVDGVVLAERLARGEPFDLGEALTLAHEVALGLAAAHESGTVHRDLKPGNIMLVGADPARPKILDFGLAFFGDERRLTLAGEAVGSVSYMAPEMLLGQVPDHRADIYALGLILYETLVGERRYEGRAQSVAAEILSKKHATFEASENVSPPVIALLNKMCGELHVRPSSARECARLISTVRASCAPGSADESMERRKTEVEAWTLASLDTPAHSATPDEDNGGRPREESPILLKKIVTPTTPAPDPSPKHSVRKPSPGAKQRPDRSTELSKQLYLADERPVPSKPDRRPLLVFGAVLLFGAIAVIVIVLFV